MLCPGEASRDGKHQFSRERSCPLSLAADALL